MTTINFRIEFESKIVENFTQQLEYSFKATGIKQEGLVVSFTITAKYDTIMAITEVWAAIVARNGNIKSIYMGR